MYKHTTKTIQTNTYAHVLQMVDKDEDNGQAPCQNKKNAIEKKKSIILVNKNAHPLSRTGSDPRALYLYVP